MSNDDKFHFSVMAFGVAAGSAFVAVTFYGLVNALTCDPVDLHPKAPLQTITYGGHDYIKSERASSGSILHSPDCPCHER